VIDRSGGLFAARQINVSPAAVRDRSSVPAASSITANARSAAASRQGGTDDRTLMTRPSRATNAMSIANRMKNVCTALEGAMMIAVPSGNDSRPSSPRRRSFESNAVRS
jgi:hypothetical protein